MWCTFFFQIQAFVKKLWESGIAAEDIGVITPYHAQVLALKTLLRNMKKVRVGTVEEFQGEEKIIITFSAVKTSGDDRATRFINCPKRLNTAISRARFVFDFFLIEFNSNEFIHFYRIFAISVCLW